MDKVVRFVQKKVNTPRTGKKSYDDLMLMDKEKLRKIRAKRLVKMRERAGFKGRKGRVEAIAKHTFNKNAYASHENGNRLIEEEAAWNYASKYKSNPLWLLYGIGKIDTPFAFDNKSIAESEIPELKWGMIITHGGAKAALEHLSIDEPFPPDGNKSRLIFRLITEDDSMSEPADKLRGFPVGTELCFEAGVEVSPGDFVLAIAYGEPKELFRQVGIQERRPDGTVVYALVPLNSFYETRIIVSGQTGDIIARLFKHTQSH